MRNPKQVLAVRSPLHGWCASLDDSPDPTFRGRMLGDGVSIDPVAGELRAPFDGEVLTLPDSRHAINLRAENGAEFLVHVGIDTVGLAGRGFEAHVRAGDRVETGQLLLSFDLETLLRGATSLRTPVLLLKAEGFSIRKMQLNRMVQPGDVIFEVHGGEAGDAAGETVGLEGADGGAAGETVSRVVVVGLEHGVHARPAAVLIERIAQLDARVSLEFEGKTADVRSPVGLMSLGTHRGSRVTVSASGRDALEALEAVVAGLNPLTDDNAAGRARPPEQAPEQSPETLPPAAGTVFRAVPASPGLARGRAALLQPPTVLKETAVGDREREQARLSEAVARVREHLQAQAAAGDGAVGEIAHAHLALLADPVLADAAERNLGTGVGAGEAWRKAVGNATATLAKLDDARMRERIDDLRDIDLRVQRALAGEDPGQALNLPEDALLLAANLLPSQLLELDRSRLRGVCLAGGGVTSHVAILAQSLRLPLLVAAGPDILRVEPGSEVLLDADLGELQLSPPAEQVERFLQRLEHRRHRSAAEAEAASQACLTRDGARIRVLANIASAADARAAVAAGAEGCGLLRTEFLFMERERAPSADEQLQVYRDISTALGDRPLVIRTLDAGGDKPIPYIAQQAEENPALGVRGIRLGLAQPGLLEEQLSALLRLEHTNALGVMLPMVSAVHEVEAVRTLLSRLGADRTGPPLRLGVMIETPAAALIADRLAGMVDFFSIGSNDLTQYTLCMDRGEPSLAGQLDALHPAVLSLIRHAVEAARRAGIPVAVCGGAAADPLAAPVLVGLGVRELSVPAGLVARQKALLRAVSVERCEEMAAAALKLGSAGAVRDMMRDYLQD